MADEEDQVGEEEEVPKGGNKLMMIIILIVGLALGGGGAFFFLQQSAGDSEGGEEGVEEVEEDDDVELFEPKYVLFEGMAVPIHNSRGKYIGNYKVTIKVLTKDDDDNVRVKNLKFELRHAFITRIAQGGFLQPNSTNLDYEKMTNILEDIAKKHVGAKVIYGLTVEDAMRVNN